MISRLDPLAGVHDRRHELHEIVSNGVTTNPSLLFGDGCAIFFPGEIKRGSHTTYVFSPLKNTNRRIMTFHSDIDSVCTLRKR